MTDFMKVFGQLKAAQAKIQAAQQKLGQLRATGEAGAGLVKVTVSGHKEVLKIVIDPTIINPDDQEMLQDLVVAAVNLAVQAVEEQVKAAIKENMAREFGDLPLDLLL